MRINDEGLLVSRGLEDRLSMEIGGRRMWVFVPVRDGRRTGDRQRLVRWPDLLLPYLNGQADVLIRSLDTSEVLLEESVTFGDGEGVVELVDKQGRPLSLDKWNHLTTAMFADASKEDRRLLVEAVAESLDFMRARGHDAFLAYGNLLGAVRDGELISHDDDADIAYLASAGHPVDIILESFAIEREFLEAGWKTLRMSGGTFKLRMAFPGGLRVGIDVFTAFYYEGLLHMMPYFCASMPREMLLPTSTILLEGREVAAPAQPEPVLLATYGSGWRDPDPSFKYKTPRWLRRRLSGLLRGERRHINYWEVFYATKASKVPIEPSSFARWVAASEPRPASLVEIGSGTGRDALWLAEQGIKVLGCDYSQAGVEYATERSEERDCSATFRRLNLYDLRQMLTAGALLAREADADAVYARFLVHSLEHDGRQNLWRFSRSVLSRAQGRIYLEFRTEATDHVFGEHYRQFVEPGVVCAELESYGFCIEHCEDRHGLAVHRNEDPRVCRIIARLKG
jgi:hypothetical protein